MFFYENHLDGGIYASDEFLDYDALYCEECGDSDWFLGSADTREDAEKLLLGDHSYDAEYIQKFLDENWID